MNLKQELQNMVNEFKLEEQRKSDLAKENAMLLLPTILEDLKLKIKKEASLGKWWYSDYYWKKSQVNEYILASEIVSYFKGLDI
jgi:hypothetical protein